MKSEACGRQVAGTESRPARALWIEIFYIGKWNKGFKVEAREGLVH